MTAKTYTITKTRHRHGSRTTSETTGTLAELTKYFGYTLKAGKSYEHEKGNRKINREPKTIKSLLTNLNNAEGNIPANGVSTTYYELA